MAKYAKSTGGNWSSATTWSVTSSDGVDDAGAPAATDDVIFDSGSTSTVTVDTTTCLAKTLTCQDAVNSITFTAAKILKVSGNVTFFPGMTLAGDGTLAIGVATASLTLGSGNVFPGILNTGYGIISTLTLVDDWVVTGLVKCSNSGSYDSTFNGVGRTLTCNGGLYAVTSTLVYGTALIILGGTGGTWSGGGTFYISITIDCTSLTIGTVIWGSTSKVLTYISGDITVTPNTTLTIGAFPETIDVSGITWQHVTIANTTGDPLTLLSDLNVSGTLTLSAILTISGNFNITCSILNRITSGAVILPAGMTLTVTDAIYLVGYGGTSNPFATTNVIKSSTTSPIYFNYLGTVENCRIFHMIFTDVDASGSSIPLYNWFGQTLTRTTNIMNISTSDIYKPILVQLNGGIIVDDFGRIVW